MELDMLKEEILDWIKAQPKGSKFTSNDVYESVHSAENPRKVSDVLRGLAKSNILDRHEFYEGNKKRFTYWLKEKPENKFTGAYESLDKTPASIAGGIIAGSKLFDDRNNGRLATATKQENNNTIIIDNHDKVKSPRILTDMVAAETKQIEIPNNFTLELKTPNGFVITIKSSDIK